MQAGTTTGLYRSFNYCFWVAQRFQRCDQAFRSIGLQPLLNIG
jgi:hypothetical protein